MNYMAQFTPNGANFQCSDEGKEAFNGPAKLFEYRIKLERTSNGILKNLAFNETCQDVKKAFCANIGKLMREQLRSDEVMMSKLIPSYQPWYGRSTPEDAYLEALQADNVALIDDPITEITKTGASTKSASEHQCIDVLALAARFCNNRVPSWNMRDEDGILRRTWHARRIWFETVRLELEFLQFLHQVVVSHGHVN